MPILIRCPISGAAFKLPNFGEEITIISTPHPLLSCNISELVKVVGIDSLIDSHILLCAWLEQLSRIGVAHWVGTLTPANFTARWHEQQLEHLANMVQWLVHNKNHPSLGIIPQIRITPELNGENLQTWRESCQHIVASYTTYFDISETLRIREQLAAAERMLNEPITSPSKVSLAHRKLHSRRTYLQNSLGLHENQAAVKLVIQVCTTPQSHEVHTIQKVKEFCLDYLPENGIENYNDKQEVIHILDAALLEKIGMAAMLGIGTPDITAELTTKYTIQVDGVSYANGAFPKVSNALAKLTNNALIGSAMTVKVYDSEPMRESFKSQLGYSIAHRQWSEQVGAKS